MRALVQNTYATAWVFLFVVNFHQCFKNGQFYAADLGWLVLGVTLLGFAASMFFFALFKVVQFMVNTARVLVGLAPVDWFAPLGD